MVFENALGRRHIVKRQDDDIARHALWHAMGMADGPRILLAPHLRIGIEADLGVIVSAVINALALGDLGLAGVRPGTLDRMHYRFGAGGGKAQMIERSSAREDHLGELDIEL